MYTFDNIVWLFQTGITEICEKMEKLFDLDLSETKAHWDFHFYFFPNLCYTSLEKSKYIIKSVHFHLLFINEWINHILGFIVDYGKLSLGDALSS